MKRKGCNYVPKEKIRPCRVTQDGSWDEVSRDKCKLSPGGCRLKQSRTSSPRAGAQPPRKKCKGEKGAQAETATATRRASSSPSSAPVSRLQLWDAMTACYDSAHAPPAINRELLENSPAYDARLFGACRVFVDRGASDIAVRRLLTEREPVNIGMNRTHYFDDRLLDAFGYEVSYYSWYYDTYSELAPNVAVYTPVLISPVSPESAAVHVIHVIGYGFDSSSQPDFDYFVTGHRMDTLVLHVQRVFDKIWACAKELGIDRVVLSLFGCTSFASRLPGGAERAYEIYLDALSRSKKSIPKCVQSLGLLLGEDQQLWDITTATGLPCAYHGHIPGDFRIAIRDGWVRDVLYVNAWDPHSMIGNGNRQDPSLDGYVGRSTTSAVLGWPPTNPFLLKRVTRV